LFLTRNVFFVEEKVNDKALWQKIYFVLFKR